MSGEVALLVGILPLVAQVILLWVYFFAAFRRLLLPPEPGPAFVLLLFLVCLPGYLLLLVWGWIRRRRVHMTSVLVGWTISLLVFFAMFYVLSQYGRNISESGAVAIIWTAFLFMSSLALGLLPPFFRADGRMRALMRESSRENIERLARLGPEALPSIRYLLEEDYQQFRLDALECLGLIGPEGIPLLQQYASKKPSLETNTARAILEENGVAPANS